MGPPLYRNQEKMSSLDRNLLHNSVILMSGLTDLQCNFFKTRTDNKSNGYKYIVIIPFLFSTDTNINFITRFTEKKYFVKGVMTTALLWWLALPNMKSMKLCSRS